MIRNEQVYDMRARGFTLKAVGSHFGITGQRVRQIVIKEGRRRDNALALSWYGSEGGVSAFTQQNFNSMDMVRFEKQHLGR